MSLPSTELKGAQPLEHTAGVGALPGNLSESSVALLPDERQERAQARRSTCLRQRRDTMKPSAAGDDDEVRRVGSSHHFCGFPTPWPSHARRLSLLDFPIRARIFLGKIGLSLLSLHILVELGALVS